MARIIAGAAKLISGVNVRWVDCEPNLNKRVYFVNHTSHFDFLVVLASLPPKARSMTKPVAAKDYWESGWLRRFLASKIFHAIFVEREHVTARNNPLQPMLEALDQGFSLIIFPEGTRGEGVEIADFKSGLYHLARKCSDVEFVPVYIDNLNRILPKGEFLPVPLLSNLSFGHPLRFEKGEKKEMWLERARQAMELLIG